ncbi:SDR family oxidoreductase [Leptospira levettii]|uniref:SDR family oxidoreductase n=1 Tax=Leptospira levettii TaxID=2023178 RepID=A0AAW5VDD5_9LEPT|nr:SDR family NAD(P)-dependent oxidoreductase [Leptospira levettii]MCW7516283.1 SDR family oxidoreductase [Leptospira levettii]
MDLKLKNKRVIVTGASRGIGRYISSYFLQEGAKVALVARNKSTLEQLRKIFIEQYDENNYLLIPCDVSDQRQFQECVNQIVSIWEGVDILVANVGNGKSSAEPISNAETFNNIFETNFRSGEVAARELIPELTRSNGNIIFISSIAGQEAFGAPTDYSVAKAAIIALSKNLARKLAPNIRVNCIAPGNVFFPGGSWDDKIQKEPERIQKLIESTVPMKRFGSPEEIADLVLFLSSERASFITGSCVVIDGGQTVGFH